MLERRHPGKETSYSELDKSNYNTKLMTATDGHSMDRNTVLRTAVICSLTTPKWEKIMTTSIDKYRKEL